MSLFAKLKQKLGITDGFFNQNDFIVQRQLAPKLRQAAIHHLAFGKGIVAQAFRGDYVPCDSAMKLKSYSAFLQQQKQNGAWGTYLEFMALGELFNFNVVVSDEHAPAPYCLYRATEGAPTVHLTNEGNRHWSVNGRTLGDGNCLYNAIAQEFQRIVGPRKSSADTQSISPEVTAINSGSFFTTKKEDVIAKQKAILDSIAKQPTPAELAQDLEREANRISQLHPDEQKQIADDYLLALSLATRPENALRPSSSLIPKTCHTAQPTVDAVYRAPVLVH